MSKLLALFVGDRSAEILDFDEAFADENYLGNIGNARDPGVADKLRIQRQQSLRLFGVSGRRSFPFQQTTFAIKFPDGVDIGDEVVATTEAAG